MNIDLHVHTSERSGCAVDCETAQIESALAHGLDGMVITDHSQLVPAARLAALNAQYAPFKIFSGIEINPIDTHEDVLVIGLHNEQLQEQAWTYAALHAFVRAHGGYLALAHPYRYSDSIASDVDTYTPDAVELHSINIGRCDEQLIQALANRLGVRTIACSDSHAIATVGIYHVQLPCAVATNAELVEALKTADYTLASDDARIAAYNQTVRAREDVIRRFLAEGKSAQDYSQATGHWEGLYNRVAMGRSYEI